MTGPLLIGIATGLVSALLFAQASTGTVLGLFVLFFLSPLPVAIAGLGWGWMSAAVAAVVAAAAVALVGTGRAAIFHVAALGAPTAVLSYLLLLSRAVPAHATGADAPNPHQPHLEWYPLGRIVMFAALWAGVLSVMAVLSTASDIDGLKAILRTTIERLVRSGMPLPPGSPSSTIGDREISALADFMALTMPGVIASAWMTIATLNLWLAGHVTRASGRLIRPWPDLATLQLPRFFPVLFAASIVATFMPGFTGVLASGFASALFFPYLLVGLAILHFVTRGSPLRGPLLAGVYMALVLFNPISGLLIALIGIAEPISPLKRRWPSSAPGGPPT